MFEWVHVAKRLTMVAYVVTRKLMVLEHLHRESFIVLVVLSETVHTHSSRQCHMCQHAYDVHSAVNHFVQRIGPQRSVQVRARDLEEVVLHSRRQRKVTTYSRRRTAAGKRSRPRSSSGLCAY